MATTYDVLYLFAAVVAVGAAMAASWRIGTRCWVPRQLSENDILSLSYCR